MKEWEEEHIRRNLPRLLEVTECNVVLLRILAAHNVLSNVEVKTIETQAIPQEKASLLYNYLRSRENAYEILTNALLQTTQSEAVKILEKVSATKLANLRIQFLGRFQRVDELLSTDEIQKVHKWLQENLSSEECEKINENILENEAALELIRNTIPPPDPLYIPRLITRRLVISPELFTQDCPDVFVFKDVSTRNKIRNHVGTSSSIESSRDVLRAKPKPVKFILLNKEPHWELLRSKIKAPLHLIRFESKTEELVVEETTGDSVFLQNYLGHRRNNKDIEFLSEEEFIQSSFANAGNGVCICDSPGMGKSLLLASIARKVSETQLDKMVLFAELGSFNFKQNPDISTVLKNNSSSVLAQKLLEAIIKQHKVNFVLFFDGLDEVRDKNLESAVNFLKNIRENMSGAKIYVTSRPVVRKKLEEAVQAISYDIQPFNEETQIRYLVKTWNQQKPTCNVESYKTFATSCIGKLNKSLKKNETSIAGIPLICKLIADVLVDNAYLYSLESDPNLEDYFKDGPTTLFEVYKKYICRQLGESECNLECMGNGDEFACSVNCKTRSFHVWQAYQLIFPILASHIRYDVNSFDKLSFQQKFSPGIMSQKNDKIEFAHRTLAEWLAAEYIYKLNTKYVHMVYNEVLFPQYREDHMKGSVLRENVVAYFLNEFLTEAETLPVPHLDYSGTELIASITACLRFEYEALLEIILKFPQSCYHDPHLPLRTPSSPMDKYILASFKVATKNCNASVIEKLREGYLQRFSFDLFVSFSKNSEHMRCVESAIKRANYDMFLLFVNSPSVQNNLSEMLKTCMENTYNDENDMVDTKLDIARLILTKWKDSGNTPEELKTQVKFSEGIHFDAMKFLIENNVVQPTQMVYGRSFIHKAAEYMNESDFLNACRFLLVGRQTQDILSILGAGYRIKFKFDSNTQPKYSHGRMLINILHLSNSNVSQVLSEQINFVFETSQALLRLTKLLSDAEFCLKYKEFISRLYDFSLEEGDVEVVDKLLNHDGFLLEKRNDVGESPAHVAIQTENLHLFEHLVSQSANIFAVDRYSRTVLHVAKQTWNWNILHCVIEIIGRKLWNPGTCVNSTDESSIKSAPSNLHELLNWTDSINQQTLLHYICVYSHTNDEVPMELLNLILTGGKSGITASPDNCVINVNAHDKEEKTALVHAFERGRSLAFIKCLVEVGAKLSPKNCSDIELGSICARQRSLEHLKYLVELGWKIDTVDQNGNNLLQIVLSWYKGSILLEPEFVNGIISTGVRLNYKNNAGKTAFDLAVDGRCSESITKILRAN